MSSHASVSLALVVTLVATPGLGSGFHTVYAAPEGCPDRAAFVRAIEQRVPDWQHRDPPVDREMALEIRRTASGFAGRLTLGPSDVREVDGAACETVVRALALVAAVSLDPAAAGESASPPAPAPPAAVPPAVVPPAPDAKPRTEPARPPPVSGAEASFGFGAAGAVLFGPAPSALYGVEVHAELADRQRRALVRAAGTRLVTGTVSVDGSRAHFELTAAELVGCYRPLRAGVLDLAGCLVVSAGQLTGAGEPGGELVATGSSTRFWGAAGARFGVFVSPLRPLELGAEAGAVVPWFKRSYIFENPRESVHTTLPVAAELRLGVTVVLP